MKLKVRRARLRTKIMAASFIPTAIILCAVAILTFYAYQRVAEELVIGRNRELIRLSASQLRSDLSNYTDLLAGLARTSDIYLGNPLTQTAALQRAGNRLVVLDAGVVILDEEGRVTATEPRRPELFSQDWSSRSYFGQLARGQAQAFSDSLSDGPQGEEVVAVAVPIRNDIEEFRGVMVGLFRVRATTFSAFYGGIVKLRIADSGRVYLLDSTGQAIYHSDSDQIGRHIPTQFMQPYTLKGQANALRTQDADGRDVLASFAPVPGTPWVLVSEEDWATLLAPSRGYGQFLLLLLALGVVIPALLVMVGIKRITDPISQLIGAAQEVAGGNFGRQLAVHTGDELEELVRQFNLMSAQLRESYTALQKRNDALQAAYQTMEQRVRERTYELDRRWQVAEALRDILALINSSRSPDDILQHIAEQACCLLNCDAIAFFQLDTESGMLSIQAAQGLEVDYVAGMVIPLGKGAVGRAASQREPIIFTKAADALAEFQDTALPLKRLALLDRMIGHYQSFFAVPLLIKGEIYGSIALYYCEARDFSDEDITLASTFASQAALAIENGRLRAQAERRAVAAERDRMSRELHDSVTQSIYSVNLYAEAAARLLDDGRPLEAANHLRELRDTAQEALREMRLLIFELRPLALEKGGLIAALRARLDAVEVRGGIQAELQVEGASHAENLSLAVQEQLYHIAQEALNNALKHANARHVRVCLCITQAAVSLDICDDGKGFALDVARESGGFGLSGMKARAARIGGTLKIDSTPGKGTTVSVAVPALNPEPVGDKA